MLRPNAMRAHPLIVVVATAGMAACSRERSPTSPVSLATRPATGSGMVPDAPPAAGPSPGPVPGVGPLGDLVLAAPVTYSGTQGASRVQRAVREAVAHLRRCAPSMAEGAVFGVGYEVDAAGQVARARIEGVADATSAACLEGAARAQRFDPPSGAFPALAVSARYRVVRRASAPLPEPSRPCEQSADCRLVAGDCSGPAAVHRDHAEAVDAEHRQRLAATPCAAPAGIAVEPVCEAGLCTARALDHAAWRRCARTSDCTAVFDTASRWQPVARGALREALAGMGARTARSGDDPPEVSCRYGACVADWAGSR